MSHPTRLLALMATIGAAAFLALTVGPPAAHAASYKTCSLTEREQYPMGTMPKPTYNLSLKRKVTSCATAKKVMKAFHGCRALASFRCTRKVATNWSCTGTKDSSTTGIFYGTFTCKFGTRRVRGSYQQNVPT